jgi:AraC-like DNA-binding protein
MSRVRGYESSTYETTPLAGITLLRARYLEHRFDKHSHDTYCLGVTLNGVQSFFCRGSQHASTPGHLMTFNPGDAHDGHSGSASGFQYRMLYIEPAVLESILGSREPGFFRRPMILDRELFRVTVGAVAAIQPQESLRAQTLLASALKLAFDRFGEARPPRQGTTRCDVRAQRLRDYLEASLDTDVTGEKLAAVADCSRMHVNRIFQRAFGLAPHAFLNAARVRRACDLMRQGVAIAEAAVAAGFADQAHFSRRFKRIYGVSPGRWLRALPELRATGESSPREGAFLCETRAASPNVSSDAESTRRRG